jgi:bifunctional enzyme CysN/CysC
MLSADQFEAELHWTGASPLVPGRRYRLALGEHSLLAAVAAPKHRLDPASGQRLAARTLRRDDGGVAVITAERPLALAAEDRFVLHDPTSGTIVATGRIRFALRRSQNVPWQALTVAKRDRAALNGHRPAAVWFTGLSGAGKSAIANHVEQRLHALGVRTYLLDGDNLRHGLNKDLGFTEADRIENIRRVGELVRLMVDAGLVVLAAFISPFRADRLLARALLEPGEFCEVFVDTPLATAEARDPKGLYAKARRGELINFTGVDSPYEPPEDPEVRVDGAATAAADAAEQVLAQLRRMGVITLSER